MPLSTSNFDIPYRDIPARQWGRVWLIVAVLVVIAIAGWELIARSMLHLPGDVDGHTNFTKQWAEERRKLDVPGHDHRVLLLGSSRLLWATDLDILEQSLGTRPLQLTIAGTGPALMFKGVVEDTDFDGLVLIGVTPFLFNRLNAGFFGKDALRWYDGASPSERIGHRIHTFMSAHLGFLDDGFKLFDLIDHYSDFPEREGVYDLSAGEWKLGRHFADRQTDMWAPIETRGSFDNEQILAFWMRGLNRRPPAPPERMAKMVQEAVEFFTPLVEQLRERGGDAVFIRMPSDGKYLENDLASNHRELIWDPMAAQIDALWINTMDYPELSSELDIPEWSHMTRQSQDDFSRRIIPLLEQRYLEVRGRSIHDIIIAPEQSN
ncbi:MAG: hypothetical protein HKM98_01270 [Gammaproteobacteria bacterium]|nr:hypothetical protein [Gammaproteobacteria bacterium]